MKTILFDTETTGLIQNSAQSLELQPHLLEFYGCLIDDSGTVLGELDFICNPGIHIPEEVTKITGLTDEKVKGLPKFENFFLKVQNLLKKADEIVAHNLSYDTSIIECEAKRLNGLIIWPKIKTCTVEGTEFIKGRRMSLTELHEHLFGEAFTDAHRAKSDVQALVRCFLELRKKGDL